MNETAFFALVVSVLALAFGYVFYAIAERRVNNPRKPVAFVYVTRYCDNCKHNHPHAILDWDGKTERRRCGICGEESEKSYVER